MIKTFRTMKQLLLSVTFSCLLLSVNAQNLLTLKLFVEDNAGRKDTLIFGLNDGPNATIQYGIDTSLGEANIYGSAQNDLDIRSILRDSASLECLVGHPFAPVIAGLSYAENIDTKIDFRPITWSHDFLDLSNNFEFSIHAIDYPVTVRADFSNFQNSGFAYFEGWSTIHLLDQNCNNIEHKPMVSFGSDSLFTLMDSSFNKLLVHFESEVATYKVAKAPTWKVFPNPATANLNIELENITSGNIQILNSIGQSVKAFSFENQDFIQLNISELPKGIYFIKLYDDEKHLVSTRKVIKE